MVQNAAGSAVDADAPLMEAGIDSLGAVELRNQLQAAIGEGVTLPSTVVFDHPTARQLALHLQGDGAIDPRAERRADARLQAVSDAFDIVTLDEDTTLCDAPQAIARNRTRAAASSAAEPSGGAATRSGSGDWPSSLRSRHASRPWPSWPSLLLPQEYALPVWPRASECDPPAATAQMRALSADAILSSNLMG